MTEHDWQTSTDPAAMLRHLEASGKRPSDARLRLWVEACRAADPDRLWGGMNLETTLTVTVEAVAASPLAARADLLRHIVGPVHRPAVTRQCETCRGSGQWWDKTRCDACNGAGWLDAMPWETLPCLSMPPCRDRMDYSCPNCAIGGRTLRWPADVVLLAEACVAEPAKCQDCGGSGMRRIYEGHGNIGEYDCSTCTGTIPASPPYFAMHDALLEAGYPELAEHFQGRKCEGCSGTGKQMVTVRDYVSLPGAFKTKQAMRPCTNTVPPCNHGYYPETHPKGCWVLDLLTGKE